MDESRARKNPGCVVALTNSRREVLLHLRDDKPGICWPGYWSLLGGGQEPGESWSETAFREVKEEAGITPDTLEETPIAPHGTEKNPPHVFLGTWEGNERDLVLGEGQALKLFPVDQLPDKMPPHIRYYLRQLVGAA